MIDEGYYAELILLAVFSLALIALILFILSKPLKLLIFILKCRKVTAEILTGEYDDSSGIPLKCVPTAVCGDENSLRIITLRADDLKSHLRFYPTVGEKINAYADENGNFTMLSYFIRTLAASVMLAAMPVLLLIGTAGMLYDEITAYHIIERILNKF